MTETNSQLGELLDLNSERLKVLSFCYKYGIVSLDKVYYKYPRKTKKKNRKIIIIAIKELELQRKSLIENYI